MEAAKSTTSDSKTRPLPQSSGMDAICALMEHVGIDCTAQELEALMPWSVSMEHTGGFLIAAQLLGLHVIPLEGEYHELPEVERPNVVTLTSATSLERTQFFVLYDIDEAGVTLSSARAEQPGSGASARRFTMDKSCFVARWTGECIAVAFDEEAQVSLRSKLAIHRNVGLRLRQAVGLATPLDRRAAFLPLAALILAGLWLSSWDHAPAIAGKGQAVSAWMLWSLGAALVASLWSMLSHRHCKTCSVAASVIGDLPLGWMGMAFYSATLLALPAGLQLDGFNVLLGTAAGIHGYLVWLLLRHRLGCMPCVLTAAAALSAATATGFLGGITTLPWLAGSALAGVLLARITTQLASERLALKKFQGSFRKAEEVLSQIPTSTPPRLLVFTNDDCPKCALYKAVVRPALKAEYGDDLPIEEHDAAELLIHTPMMLLSGPLRAMFLTSQFDDIAPIVDQALHGVPETMQQRGFWIVRSE